MTEPETEPWKPLPGPQTDALESKADILFYGGAAGGGKTDLLIGAAHTLHRRSIIFRREYTQLQGIIERTREVLSEYGKFNKSDMIWAMKDGRTIELGAVQYIGDERKYQGRAHDLKAFDELTHFSEMQFRTLCGWLRTADAAQRCRVLATGNPPGTSEGEWVFRFFAPWLDHKHAHPAEFGELRWFTTIDGHEVECDNGEPFEHKGEWIVPKSRTFIPARVEDNPYYMESGYKSTLQAMPEPLRTQLLKGDFNVGREDDAMQLIPTEWVEQAIQRWLEADLAKRPKLSAIGVDVARGGTDRTVITLRYGYWFARQLVHPGKTTKNGDVVAQLVLAAKEDQPCKVQVDIIGVGGSVYDVLHHHLGDEVVAMNSAHASEAKDRSGKVKFRNKRAEWWWKLREALDPYNGSILALPDDRELLADLVAPRYENTIHGIQVELKDAVSKRLGRSPDKGDSLIYAHAVQGVTGQGMLDVAQFENEKK